LGDRPFKIPGRTNDLIPFCEGLIQDCYSSLETRRSMYSYFRSFYYTGSKDGKGTKHNKCFSHIDKLSSLLYSASELRFDITFDNDETEEWSEQGDLAARYLTREYIRAKSGLAFGAALDVALVSGCAFIKKVNSRSGPRSFVVRPQFMGVLREDVTELDDQDAFVHSFYVTPAQLNRLLMGRPDRGEIMLRVTTTASKPSSFDLDGGDYFHEIVMGGLQPITTTGVPSGGMGTVSPYATPSPMLAPEVAESLIRVDDLWVMDDEREDWTTLRYIDPGVILEGADRHRNLSDVPKEQPFTRVCPNDVVGYIWGMSELAGVTGLQDLYSARMNDADQILKRQANPSRAFIGFNSITPERAAALMSLNGMLSDDSPTGKIETLAPSMPPDLLPWINFIGQAFDDQAGITNIASGQGEQGVRSGNHANTLLRTSTPRLRDRALIVEEQLAEDGDRTLKMLQTKIARVFKTQSGKEFLLEQLPEDANVVVDSHSSSPAFSGDQMQIAFALRKADAIDNLDLLDMIPGLPRAAELKLKAKKREEEKAKFLQAHPELLTKGRGHK
jgi:hypothetical protein